MILTVYEGMRMKNVKQLHQNQHYTQWSIKRITIGP